MRVVSGPFRILWWQVCAAFALMVTGGLVGSIPAASARGPEALGEASVGNVVVQPGSVESVGAAVGTSPALAAGRPVGAAQPSVGAPSGVGTPVRVLVKETPPFVQRHGQRWTGWAVDLWAAIARRLGLTWEITGAAQAQQIVEAIAAGSTDVGLGAIPVTASNAQSVDFSHPVYRSGARILAPVEYKSRVATALASLRTPGHFGVAIGLLAGILGMTGTVYALARRHDRANFPPGRSEGLIEALYVAVNALVTGKLERRLMPGAGGRIISLLWLLLGALTLSYFTAAVTTALTVHHLGAEISDFPDLARRKVAAVAGYPPALQLVPMGVQVLPEPTLEQAIARLQAREVDAVVHDESSLGWWLAGHPGSAFELVGRNLDPVDYAIVFGTDSPLRSRINVVVLELKDEGFLRELDRRWLVGGDR